MYIGEIVIDGFKSYASRTVLSGFDPHFNAITGLNGSGKSNILDSICFVLGISNLSQVRASNLSELVYKQGQAGVTKASVTLVFNNQDKKNSPIGYEAFDQITVARQVVIGGKNKYLINGHVSQASQVQNLFHSVQLNVNNPHFLIMQGRITKVLNMKPPEILGMIEEAAGTRMFENKKQNALKTMEKKQSKVDEINSILSNEITPTLERLRNERSHYLKWSSNNAEAERLERFCVAYNFCQLESTASKSETAYLKMKSDLQEMESKIKIQESCLKEKEVKLQQLTLQREKQAQGEYKKLLKNEEKLSKELVQLNSEWTNKNESLAEEQKNLDLLRLQYDEGLSLQESKKIKIEESISRIKESEKVLSNATEQHQKLQNYYQNMCAGVNDASSSNNLTFSEQMAELSKLSSEANAREKQSLLKLERLKATLVQVQHDQSVAEREIAQLKCELKINHERLQSMKVKISKIDFNAESLKNLILLREKEEKVLSSLLHKKEELSAKLEGRLSFKYDSPYHNFDRNKVKGLVAKLVCVQKESSATALEVVAGNKLFQVVVDDEKTGKDLLQKGNLKKRVTIIPLNKIARGTLKDSQISKAKNIASTLNGSIYPSIELVGFDEEVRSAIEYTFGSSFICDSLDIAKSVAFDKNIKVRTVTLEGDSFEPSGTLTGGSKSQLSTILSKLFELDNVIKDINSKQIEISNLSSSIKILEEGKSEYFSLKQELSIHEEKVLIMQQQIDSSAASQMKSRKEDMTEQLKILENSINEDRMVQTDATQKIQDLKFQEGSFRQKRETVLTELLDQVKMGKKEISSAKYHLKQAQQELQIMELEFKQLEKDSMQLKEQLGSIDDSNSSLKNDIDSLHRKVTEKQSAYDQANEALRKMRNEISAMDSESRNVKGEYDELSKQRDESQIELKKHQHKIQKCGKDGENAQKSIEHIKKKYSWIETERSFFGQEGSDYDFKSRDVENAQKRLKSIQTEQVILSKKINKKVTGMIEKAESEYRELVHKRKVIEEDKTKIHSVITELDQKKNQALQTTWVKVNRDFGSIFSTLLPGTSAKLEPSEGSTVLEGLEVKVAFGSVWKESLTELSGGQRSLLALSLILSLLLFKPAPMYILDEVDAALDLSHTQNIGTMLRTHFSHSQFILVSLKEGMFNNANVIFTTKFVDGVSTVQRRALNLSALTHHIDSNGEREEQGRKKRQKVSANIT